MSAPERQAARHVLLIRPAGFGRNPQTAASNVFQPDARPGETELVQRARQEFDRVVAMLADAGVVPVVESERGPPWSPDGVFPNNWVSLHASGRAILYPMWAANRRVERRPEILESLQQNHGFLLRETVNLTGLESGGLALEGTGSLVLDRSGKRAFAALSPRTDAQALAMFQDRTGYRVTRFRTRFRDRPVYHTNVMLSLGSAFAVICDHAVQDAGVRAALLQQIEASGRTIIRINPHQMGHFAANLLELDSPKGPVIALSARALAAFSASQRRQLEAFGTLVTVPLPAIETGGGSLRCMLAEIFLPLAGRGPG